MEWEEGGYQVMENIDHYGCLTKKNCQLKSSQWLEVLLTLLGVGDVSFHYKSDFPKEFLASVSKF